MVSSLTVALVDKLLSLSFQCCLATNDTFTHFHCFKQGCVACFSVHSGKKVRQDEEGKETFNTMKGKRKEWYEVEGKEGRKADNRAGTLGELRHLVIFGMPVRWWLIRFLPHLGFLHSTTTHN